MNEDKDELVPEVGKVYYVRLEGAKDMAKKEVVLINNKDVVLKSTKRDIQKSYRLEDVEFIEEYKRD